LELKEKKRGQARGSEKLKGGGEIAGTRREGLDGRKRF